MSLLKTGGQTLGWGFQFQHPLFLAILALVLVLFSANIQGLFFLCRALNSHVAFQPRGPAWTHPFINGVFITVLCNALFSTACWNSRWICPHAGAVVILGIFLMLGIGMATPYLAVAGLPKLGQILPRPGPWMVRLKSFLSVLLLATAGWLIWIVTVQSEVIAATTLLLGLMALGVLHIKAGKKINVSLSLSLDSLLSAP